MNCPICDCFYSEMFKFINCENFDNSYLYKDVHIIKCSNCDHIYNKLSGIEINNLKDYYKYEHTLKNKVGDEQRKKQLSEFISPYITEDPKILNVEINNAYLIPFEDNSFDVIILDQILEHLVDLKLVMKQIKRVLKKNGICRISVPDSERYNDIYWYIMREHVQHFNITTLKLLAQLNGFELIRSSKTESDMVGTLKLPNLSVILKVSGKVYCWGIGREFMYLYPNTRLKNLDLILVDDTPQKQKQTFKGMKIHSSNILKEAPKDSFLIITAITHKELLKKKALKIGYSGEIIDV